FKNHKPKKKETPKKHKYYTKFLKNELSFLLGIMCLFFNAVINAYTGGGEARAKRLPLAGKEWAVCTSTSTMRSSKRPVKWAQSVESFRIFPPKSNRIFRISQFS
ncbi:hypothetical protein KEJ49_03665, partial [Candidatus Bathyarchaeota archaeon]|nr:hypothetical protein [Candidatus Bathyarchaeota archaeon]